MRRPIRARAENGVAAYRIGPSHQSVDHMLAQVAIFLAAAIVAVPLSRKLGLGAVLGYLAAGMLIGPWGLKLIDDVEMRTQPPAG